MADLYRSMSCPGCGKAHDLYDTSAVRHSPGGTYAYTCPRSGLVITLRLIVDPMIVPVLPADALPVDWISSSQDRRS
jgi:hypothetical protein